MRSARTLLRGEPGYPARLAATDEAPPQLRLAGELGPPGVTRVALVGARASDDYGLDMARSLAAGLARAGVSVISGGARGVDGAAHEGALAAGGHTVAVLGTGVDVDYPVGNRRLFERILAAGGALLSELEDGTQGSPWSFPRRNRIISGLSDAVVVVRAGEKSGALITADWARRQRVPLLAVPGDADNPLSAGPLGLLRTGARLVTRAADVLELLGLAGQAELPLPGPELQGPAAAVWAALSRSPQHADELARAAGLPPGAALAALLELELSGLAEQRPGQRFLRKGAGA
ncbi:MAG: DNA-protecting protein DprA [Deltaproteobacteria bacterium]|nr:DNA-protecting protein DprA [Deltaproteobacteria bacterium]